jgi:predicted NAD/FAD-dependent oxidoreductase
MKKILVVGAGFSGSVIARNLAENGIKVVIIDKRTHIGGNAFDFLNEYGIRVHKYGPHLFHTNNKIVYEWLSQYTEWIPYKHKVKAILKDGTYTSTEVVDGDTETVNGRWVWMNSAKNKTMISLDNLGAFEVNGLKSKELLLKIYSKDVSVSGGETFTDESTATWTFEKQK